MILAIVDNKNIDLAKKTAGEPVVFANASLISKVDFLNAEKIIVDNKTVKKVEEFKEYYKGVDLVNCSPTTTAKKDK